MGRSRFTNRFLVLSFFVLSFNFGLYLLLALGLQLSAVFIFGCIGLQLEAYSLQLYLYSLLALGLQLSAVFVFGCIGLQLEA
jgi:hypothetical protein